MSVALLFAGQGAEEPEMGLALAAVDRDAAALLDEASRVTGVDVARALARGGRAIQPTAVLQPVLLAVGLAAGRALVQQGLRPTWVAGHSLGELTAACFAAELSPRAAVELAAARGALMTARPGGMLALDAELAEVEAALATCGGVIGLAAVNAPRELVVSGSDDAIASLRARFGARATPLRVAGPWHSALLADAVAPLRTRLAADFEGRALGRRLASACSVRELDAASIADALADALVRPVRFVELLELLAREGVSDVVVAAPSRVVRSLVRRTLGTRVAIHAADDPVSIERVAKLLV